MGDKRRTKRLKAMAARMAEKPGGKLTRVFESVAELEGAYRFIENSDVSIAEMERARGEACARRLASASLTIVPVDRTTIRLPEQRKTQSFGAVGAGSSGAPEVHLMTALALDDAGAVRGVLRQERWLRSELQSPPHRAEDRASDAWVTVLDGCHQQLTQHAPAARAWYQCDLGGEFRHAFAWAHEHQALLTARVLVDPGLHPWVETQALELPERTVHLSVRFGTTTIQRAKTATQGSPMTVSVVEVCEPRPPRRTEPVRWLLWTTYPVLTRQDATRVLHNYALRSRCEEFHRTLKTGACDIETSELEHFENFSRLLVIASSVATRIERINFLSHTEPNPAAAAS